METLSKTKGRNVKAWKDGDGYIVAERWREGSLYGNGGKWQESRISLSGVEVAALARLVKNDPVVSG